MTDPNLQLLEAVALRLGRLSEEFVFVGGAVVGLLLTDEAAPPARPTRDVDVVVEATTVLEYEAVKAKLREAGFREEPDAPHLCRWTADDVLLDVMPTDAGLLGFTNTWYVPAVRASMRVSLASGRTLRCVTAPYLLATKVEAFRGRGNADYYASTDLEDLVALLNGRPEIVDELANASPELLAFLGDAFRTLLDTPDFLQALPGLAIEVGGGSGREGIVLQRMRAIVDRPPGKAT